MGMLTIRRDRREAVAVATAGSARHCAEGARSAQSGGNVLPVFRAGCLAALVVDHFGLMGMPRDPLTIQRAVGLALVAAGAVVIRIQELAPGLGAELREAGLPLAGRRGPLATSRKRDALSPRGDRDERA